MNDMMNNNTNKYLNLLAHILKVPLEKNEQKRGSFTSTVFQLVEASQLNLGGRDAIENAEILQFIEYVLVYASQIDNSYKANIVLQELDGILALKTYLVRYRLTIADVLLFYVLWGVMSSLTMIEKEKYINVCRWFDNIQQESLFCQSNKIVDFGGIYLASVAPARH